MEDKYKMDGFEEIEDLEDEFYRAESCLVNAKDEYEFALKKLQANCKHELVTETPTQHYKFISDCTPRRICETCGFEEESHNFFGSWTVLTTERRKIENSREEFYKLRK